MKRIAARLLLVLSLLVFVSAAETNRGSSLNHRIAVKNNRPDSASNISWRDKVSTVPAIVWATDPIVTTNADSGAGSLRSAIQDACAGSTITFDMTPSHVTSPITLTSGQLLIGKNLTIQGPGANLLTVSGNNANRIVEVNSGFTVTSRLSVSTIEIFLIASLTLPAWRFGRTTSINATIRRGVRPG